MEQAGNLAKEVIEKAGKKVKSIKESTSSGLLVGYKCKECGKLLTWKELKIGQDQEIPILACEEHLDTLRKKTQKQRFESIRLRIDAVLNVRNIPLRFWDCSFENFQAVDENRKKNLRISREYVKKHGLGQGLFFTGPNGTGKTHLAVAILRELSLKGELHWRFVKTPYLLMRIRQAFKRESSDSEESLIDQFVDYDYLAIDELGVEKITDWSLQTLYLIIDGRNDRLKSTIITSNLDLPEIEEKIDPRIASRIVEMCRVIKFECDDWRIRMRRKR